MLPVTNRLGLRIKMKRTAAGLTRKEMSIYLGGKPSPYTIFNVEMGSPHKQTKKTFRLVKEKGVRAERAWLVFLGNLAASVRREANSECLLFFHPF